MLHARLVRPPSVHARFSKMDEISVKDRPGLVEIVQRGNFIGVVAEREEQAIQAAKKLKVEWEKNPPFHPCRICTLIYEKSPPWTSH